MIARLDIEMEGSVGHEINGEIEIREVGIMRMMERWKRKGKEAIVLHVGTLTLLPTRSATAATPVSRAPSMPTT